MKLRLAKKLLKYEVAPPRLRNLILYSFLSPRMPWRSVILYSCKFKTSYVMDSCGRILIRSREWKNGAVHRGHGYDMHEAEARRHINNIHLP